MLTRIEIDGFKSFRSFSLDIPPFLVIIGRNAAGKSNLFDAIQFLSRLAGDPVLEAAQHMRGDVVDLFHRPTVGPPVDEMTFAAEVLLDRSVTDAFGDTAEVNHSRLRYELTIQLRSSGYGGSQRPYVVREAVRRIRRADDNWMKLRTADQRKRLATYRSGADPLETEDDDVGRPVFSIRQQGNQGRKRKLPATSATATVLSSLTTATDFPLLYALKREMQSWRLLHLDPSALRAPDSYDDPDGLSANGGHLANTLRRLADETATPDRPEGVLNDLSADLAAVIPGVIRVRLSEDEARRQRQIMVLHTRDEAPFSARVASDGTLRAIALLAALYDPRGAGLICFEEPENGIFPQRLAQFVRYLRNLVDRALNEPSGGAALTQLILSSHSPAILRALDPAQTQKRTDAVFMDVVSRVQRGHPPSRVSRWRAIAGAQQLTLGDVLDVATVVSPSEIAEFEVQAELGT